jgi:hypothetical protein
MDSFGWVISQKLILNDSLWMKCMELNSKEEFEPDTKNWKILFDKLNYVVTESGLKGKLNGTYNFSPSVPTYLNNLGATDDLIEAKNSNLNLPIEFGLHSTHGDNDLVLNERFPIVLKKDIKNADSIHSTLIVEHPPIGIENTIQDFVNELVSDPIISLLESTKQYFCWENKSDYRWKRRFFGSLKQMVTFYDLLEDKLQEIGKKNLIGQHLFCFDTGHLLIWRETHADRKIAEKEIEEYLPIFAKKIKIFHLHANDGIHDNHLTPFSLENWDLETRKDISPDIFLKNSQTVLDWIKICEENKTVPNRQFVLETLKLPFSFKGFINFGKKLNEIL